MQFVSARIGAFHLIKIKMGRKGIIIFYGSIAPIYYNLKAVEGAIYYNILLVEGRGAWVTHIKYYIT